MGKFYINLLIVIVKIMFYKLDRNFIWVKISQYYF